MKVRGGEFYPVGNTLTPRQELQYQEIWTSMNRSFPGVDGFANKLRTYTQGENAAILQKKDPKLLLEMKALITAIQRFESAMN